MGVGGTNYSSRSRYKDQAAAAVGLAAQNVPTGLMTRRSHPLAADQDETVDDLLRTSARRSRSVPLRRAFVQQGAQNDPRPGPLAALLRAHDERGLDLFLLHRAVASSEPWDVTRDARVWARALGLQDDADAGVSAVSRTWHRLDTSYSLISRTRRGRLAEITALREDGLGKPYTYPKGLGRQERYFKLPYEYWTADQRWYRVLPFRAKAMLLVSLSLPANFVLPTERVPRWYGISADSADRGLRELDKAGLLRRELKVKKAPQSPMGISQEYHHVLLEPFAQRRTGAKVTRLRSVS
jgi:hypothetical protein